MRDYEILRKALMDAWRGQYCSECELNSLCQDDDSNCWFKQAADAIEELQGKLKELYRLTCDINKNEINAQIEWGNLDNFLRAFRKYADKIAGVELPAPPKEDA